MNYFHRVHSGRCSLPEEEEVECFHVHLRSSLREEVDCIRTFASKLLDDIAYRVTKEKVEAATTAADVEAVIFKV